MKKVRVLTAEEAALLVNDGDTIATGGFVSPRHWRSGSWRRAIPEI